MNERTFVWEDCCLFSRLEGKKNTDFNVTFSLLADSKWFQNVFKECQHCGCFAAM